MFSNNIVKTGYGALLDNLTDDPGRVCFMQVVYCTVTRKVVSTKLNNWSDMVTNWLPFCPNLIAAVQRQLKTPKLERKLCRSMEISCYLTDAGHISKRTRWRHCKRLLSLEQNDLKRQKKVGCYNRWSLTVGQYGWVSSTKIFVSQIEVNRCLNR